MNHLVKPQLNVFIVILTQAMLCRRAGGVPVWRLPGEEQGHSEWRTDQCAEGQQGEEYKHRHTSPLQYVQSVGLNTSMRSSKWYEASTEIKANKPAAHGELWHLVYCLLSAQWSSALHWPCGDTVDISHEDKLSILKVYVPRGLGFIYTQHKSSKYILEWLSFNRCSVMQ